MLLKQDCIMQLKGQVHPETHYICFYWRIYDVFNNSVGNFLVDAVVLFNSVTTLWLSATLTQENVARTVTTEVFNNLKHNSLKPSNLAVTS